MTSAAIAAEVNWNGAIPLDNSPTFAEGLREARGAIGDNNINQAANLFTDKGVVNGPRLGQTNTKPADANNNPDGVWSDNQVWRYTGEFFDTDGIFTFAENIDDQVRLFIDGVLVLSNDVWNAPTASANGGAGNNYGAGPNGTGWHTFEVRFQNGTGGAGTVAQNGWGGGDNATYANKGFGLNINGTTSTNGADYIIPIETMNGTPDLFRHVVSGAAGGDTVHITANSSVTLSGAVATVTQSSISFETGVTPVSLTVNSVDAIPRTLASDTTHVGNGGPTPASSTDITFNVATTHTFKPGQVMDGTATGVSITKIGGGALVFDATTASDMDGTTLKLNDGLTSVVSNGTVNPLGNLGTIEVNTATARLRFGGGGAYSQSITVNESSTIDHTASSVDRVDGAVNIGATKTLTADVSAGALRFGGGVNAGAGQLTKVGNGALVLGGTATIQTLNQTAGRTEVYGQLHTTTVPNVAGGALALYSTGNSLPATIPVNTGGALDIVPGAVTGSVHLAGGVLTLSASPGLLGRFYNGGNAEALDTAFGGPDRPNNTYANFVTYFSNRDSGAALTPAAVTAATTNGGVYAFAFNQNLDGAPYTAFGFNTADNLVARMSGLVRIPQAGMYTFSTTSDDGSMLYIDGQAVASNNGNHGMRPASGSIFLEAGMHQVDIGMFEGTGGAGLVVEWAGPGITGTQVMTNSNFRQVGAQTFVTAIDVQQNSTIEIAAQEAIATSLTIQPGVGRVLTKTGGQLTTPVNLNGAGTYGFDVAGSMVLTDVINGGAVTNINKTGSGVLILDNTTTPQFTGGGTITVSQGALGILLQTGGSAPNGGANIAFAGGGVVLSSKGGDQSFAIPNFPGDGVIEARQIGTGVAGPVSVNLTGNLAVNDGQTVSLGSGNGYTLTVGGAASGTGTVRILSGTVNSTSPGAVNGLHFAMAPLTSATSTLASSVVNLASLASQGAGPSTLNVGTGSGTAVLTLNTAGNARFRGQLNAVTGNTLDVVMAGAGTQTLDSASSNNVASFSVDSGVLELVGGAAGNAAINLDGGTLRIASRGLFGEFHNLDPGPFTGGYNALNTLNSTFSGFGAPLVTALTTANGQTNLDYNNASGGNDAPFTSIGFAPGDNIQVRWSGRIYISTPGNYTFGAASDDGSMVFIDGNAVVNNNAFQGWGPPKTGNVTLTEGYHDLTLAFYEGGGGAGVAYSWQPPGTTTLTAIPNSVLSTVGSVTLSNQVNLNTSSTIDPRGGVNNFGVMDQDPDTTLTTTGGTVAFSEVTLETGGTVGYDVGGTLRLNKITPENSPVTINKSGAGTLVLGAPASPQLQSPSNQFNVNAGALLAIGGANSPLGLGSVRLANNTELQVTSSGGNVVFPSAVTLAPGGATARITAGRFGTGVASTIGANVSTAIAAPLNTGAVVELRANDNYHLVMAGDVGGTNINVTAGTVIATANFTSPAITVATGAVLAAHPGTGNTRNYGPVQLNGGIFHVQSGTADFGANAISGTPQSSAANQLAGRINFTGGEFVPAFLPGNAEAAIRALQVSQPDKTGTLTNALVFANDGAFTTFFNDARTNSRYTAAFFGKVNVPVDQVGTDWRFQAGIVDDQAGLWVDLNDNGVFEANGSAGNELISGQGCCTDGPVGTANLLPGRSYNVAFAMEDTGGGGSFSARFARPGGGPLGDVDPSAVAQAGLWSAVTPGTGGIVSINSGSELRVGRIDALTSLLLNGNNSKAVVSRANTTDSLRAISTAMPSGGSATLELAATHHVNVNTLSVAQGTTLIKAGEGTLTAATQSLGNGGTLRIDAGTVNLDGTQIASNGASSAGGVVVNNSAILNISGVIAGPVTANGAALISINGVAGAATVNGGVLSGTGTLAGLTINAGGTVAPGNSIGTLTATSLTMSDTAVLSMELASGLASDVLVVNGAVTLLNTGGATGGSLALSLLPTNSGFFATPGDVFGLIKNDGVDPVVGTFAQGTSIAVGEHVFTIGYAANLDGGAVANDVALTYVVPEPGAAVMLLGGLATLMGIRRARRHA